MTTLNVRFADSPTGAARYFYELRTGEGAAPGPLEQEYSVDVNQAFVKDLCTEIDRLLEGAGGANLGEPGDELVQRGKMLYNLLFPRTGATVPELVKLLKQSTGPLLIRSNEALVPWELLHNGEQFLGLAHELGRRSVVAAQVSGGRSISHVSRALVVGDALGDLTAAREEVEKVAGWLSDRGIDCTVLVGEKATVTGIVTELASEQKPYDLFHFSGHVSDAHGASGLLVHRRELLDASALQALDSYGAPPVVFINGCASAGQTANVCKAFMVMGAKTVVGTRTEVADTSALRFAELFYAQLQEHEPAGAAVRNARAALKDEADGTWASFVLYGDPAAHISGKHREPPAEPSLTERLTPAAVDVLERSERIAAPHGLITSLDLLAGLLETEALRADATERIGEQRMELLSEVIAIAVDSSTASGGRPLDSGTPVPLSDTVLRVLDRADDIASTEGRQSVAVKDIVAGFQEVGGGSCARLLEVCEISLTELFGGSNDSQKSADSPSTQLNLSPVRDRDEPSKSSQNGSRGDGGTVCGSKASNGPETRDLNLDTFGPRVAGVLRCAQLLAAARGEPVSTYLLLFAFAVVGSQPLHNALAEQGQHGEKAFRKLSTALKIPTRLTKRTRSMLERVRQSGDDPPGEAEVLCALLAQDDSSARQVLASLGVDPDLLLEALRRTD